MVLGGLNRCPLWVKSRHVQRTSRCPLYPRKRTFRQSDDLCSVLARSTELGFDEFGEGKNLRPRPLHSDLFQTGLSFLPNWLKAARDCQTSITRQPPGIGPAMCASSPLTGQSASLFLRPFNINLTLFSYLARDVAPRNSKRTPMGMRCLHVSANLESVSGSGGDVRFGSKADIAWSAPLMADSFRRRF